MAAHASDDPPRAGEGAVDGSMLGALLARVRRYWPLVLIIVWLAALGAVAATERAPTTYVGRTSLIVSSPNRSPDQDAVLVQGYVTYFNDAAYQADLLKSAGVSSDVSLEAAAAATSPILVINATTSDAASAQTDAVKVAEAFRDDINRIHAENDQKQLVALQDQLDTVLASNNGNAAGVVSDLQNQIQQLQADQTNVLQDLQQNGGVTVQKPSLFRNLLPAVAGGLLLGVLAALVLAGVSRRLRSARDVADKLGVPTLVELPRSRGRAGRARQEQRFGQLANIARVRLGGPGVVAVAQPEEGIASSVIARELAREWARQGYPTVLVETGAGAVLDSAEPAALRVRPGPVPGLSLLQLGPRSAADAPVLSVSKVTEMLAQEALAGQYVVIEAPGVAQSAAAQAVCHAADQTLLVIDTRVTLVPAGREAVAVLRQMDARLMGAVVASRLHDRGEDEAPQGEPARLAGSLAEGSSPVDAVLHDARPPVDGTRSAALRQGVQRSQE